MSLLHAHRTRQDPASEIPDARRLFWERRASIPLSLAAVVFLAAYAWPILDPAMSAAWKQRCQVVSWATWGLFVVDYVVRLVLAEQRGRFVRHNLLDLATVVLPPLRPLRLLRVVRVLSVLNRIAGSSLRGQVAVFVTSATLMVLFVSSLAVLDAERAAPPSGPQPSIGSFPDALWWSFSTVTTVGYGDKFPVTGGGRFVAVLLMLCGIALLGIVTAGLASWLLDRVAAVNEENQAATRLDIRELLIEVSALREEIQSLRNRA